MRGGFILAGAVLVLSFLLPSAVVAEEARGIFYGRLAVGYDWSRDSDLRDRSCDPAPRLAYFGCQPGNDGRRIGAYGDFGGSLAGEIAVGARVLPALRLEVALSHRPGFKFDGNANFLASGNDQPVEADMSQSAAMVNAYLDLAPLLEADLGRFEPFLSAGIGVSRNKISKVHYSFPDLPSQPAWTDTRGGTHWDLAWSLGFGTAIRITPHSLLELSYRYSDFGRVATSDGPITVRRGANQFQVANVAGTRGRLRSHGLYLGFRQEF